MMTQQYIVYQPLHYLQHTKQNTEMYRRRFSYLTRKAGKADIFCGRDVVESFIFHPILILLFLKQEGRKEMFYLTTHSTHFIYDYMAFDIW